MCGSSPVQEPALLLLRAAASAAAAAAGCRCGYHEEEAAEGEAAHGERPLRPLVSPPQRNTCWWPSAFDVRGLAVQSGQHECMFCMIRPAASRPNSRGKVYGSMVPVCASERCETRRRHHAVGNFLARCHAAQRHILTTQCVPHEASASLQSTASSRCICNCSSGSIRTPQ